MNEGKIVRGVVKSISHKHFWVDLSDGYQGIVFISEVSDYFVQDISKFVSIGETINLKVISFNEENKKATLSFKAIRSHLLKNPYINSLEPTKNGFKNLINHAEKELKTWKKSN